ncbi:DUF4982 domain-containing protein [Paenibacillus sp. D2_2]|uniref:DUF4982 domain-containing protein n=1 Tax=Paenibacillus sp. D2_2 TaxID=3073092 RepID=UPI002815F38E|nr:DUF4982 domain-containing protein [Paenibacillus sp. D2_2]WMT41325.1 DUF4982 domain-containing protein [Paenibacillus sp. D2_2]
MNADLIKEMNEIIISDMVGNATAESFAAVDIAGYNYMDARYLVDKEKYPNRIICGSETFPGNIDNNWGLVKRHSHIIGDFTWTGWDYLGEAGVGKVLYDIPNLGKYDSPFPWLTAWCGDIDLIGNRRPISYYREIVFGLRSKPYIAVHRPEFYGKEQLKTNWSWSDSVSSWTWTGYEGKPIKVEVYSDADEVELLVNGQSVGKAETGETNRFMAVFDTIYEAGEIVAIAYTDNKEIGRTVLHSASGAVLLDVDVDRTEIVANDKDLSFITITLVDQEGNLYNTADRKVSVRVEGAGMLQGFGSADPKSDEEFFATERTTFDGKVLAVIRPTSVGTIAVTVSAEGCASKSVKIEAR